MRSLALSRDQIRAAAIAALPLLLLIGGSVYLVRLAGSGPAGVPLGDPSATAVASSAASALITALLIYFGYIATRARLEYFGVDLDMAALSNQDLVLSGLEVIYFPAAMVFFAVLGAAIVHAVVTFLITVVQRDAILTVLAGTFVTVGLLLVGRGLVGLFVLRVSTTEFPGTTALSIAIGPCVLVYGWWTLWRVLQRNRSQRGARTSIEDWHSSHAMSRVRRIAGVGVAGLLVAGLFWAANSFAWSFGGTQAYEDARRLSQQPEVVIDTKERLVDVPADVDLISLDLTPGDPFRYRYRGFRLLMESDNRLFLVPTNWDTESRTVIVPYDSNVRIQLIPAR